MEWFADPNAWVSLVTLTLLEIVLGIDNLVFIAILAARLPAAQRDAARKTGLAFALITRLLLLATLSWIIGLTTPVLTMFGSTLSWRDIILTLGGLFLLGKATHEIHNSLEGQETTTEENAAPVSFVFVVAQIAVIDIVFSLDSVITAVGMAQQLSIMVIAVVLAMLVMLIASTPLSNFIARHPTVKMLALSFLLLIGTALIADGMGFHIPKGYLYVAMGFSVLVESLNQFARRRKAIKPIELRRGN
ncbi:MAG: TerC family protein [Pseudomonadota bacterium]|nr:TerC family protein [Pseudomonadota bacterium]